MQRIKQENLEIRRRFLLLYALSFDLCLLQPLCGSNQRYTLYAKFKKVQGVNIGDEVRIGGVVVGTVARKILITKPSTPFWPLPSMLVQTSRNSKATINADGIIGGKYVKIEPGNDKEPEAR